MHHTHHLMVFMREDVAVPDVASGLVEGGFDTGDLPGQSSYHILAGVLDIFCGLRHRRSIREVNKAEPVSQLAIMLHHSLCDQVGSIAIRSGSSNAVRI